MNPRGAPPYFGQGGAQQRAALIADRPLAVIQDRAKVVARFRGLVEASPDLAEDGKAMRQRVRELLEQFAEGSQRLWEYVGLLGNGRWARA